MMTAMVRGGTASTARATVGRGREVVAAVIGVRDVQSLGFYRFVEQRASFSTATQIPSIRFANIQRPCHRYYHSQSQSQSQYGIKCTRTNQHLHEPKCRCNDRFFSTASSNNNNENDNDTTSTSSTAAAAAASTTTFPCWSQYYRVEASNNHQHVHFEHEHEHDNEELDYSSNSTSTLAPTYTSLTVQGPDRDGILANMTLALTIQAHCNLVQLHAESTLSDENDNENGNGNNENQSWNDKEGNVSNVTHISKTVDTAIHHQSYIFSQENNQQNVTEHGTLSNQEQEDTTTNKNKNSMVVVPMIYDVFHVVDRRSGKAFHDEDLQSLAQCVLDSLKSTPLIPLGSTSDGDNNDDHNHSTGNRPLDWREILTPIPDPITIRKSTS